MPDYKDPREEDIVYGDRRLSRPDNSLPDWEMPDTAYRPVPIVWFTGAFFLELFVLFLLGAILSAASAWLSIGLSALATGAIAMWTWDRGMRDAGTGWQIATGLMLIVMLGFAILAAGTRI